MSTKVLLATTCRWFAAARLAMAFKHAGCVVDMVCPTGHPVTATRASGRLFPYHGLAPLYSFRAAMVAAEPEIVIPCDDLARTHLNQLYSHLRQGNGTDGALRELLERSLGDPVQYPVIEARSKLIGLARELEISAPETVSIATPEELLGFISRSGLPVVLKSDGTSGGMGVKIAQSDEEALLALAKLSGPPHMVRAAKRALVDRDTTLLIPWLLRHRPNVCVQRFLPSRDATLAVACWRGEILASVGVEVLRTWKPKGPASVVRLIENREMLLAAQKLAGHLKLSGLYGFDFVLERDGSKSYLIEMNARATQICHLALGRTRNLPAALIAAAAGKPVPDSASVTQRDVIALFPLEWQNDPASPFLRLGFHDVPWEEPKLVIACVESRMRNGGWLTYENLDKMLAHLHLSRT